MAENQVGRPTDYSGEYNQQAHKLCLLGATDKQLADFFECSESTLNLWKINHPAFSESIKSGKLQADAVIAESLFHRAKGYKHEAVKIFCSEGVTIEHPYTEHYAPDTVACIFWLKNRQPELWRDKVTNELSGINGGPLEISWSK